MQAMIVLFILSVIGVGDGHLCLKIDNDYKANSRGIESPDTSRVRKPTSTEHLVEGLGGLIGGIAGGALVGLISYAEMIDSPFLRDKEKENIIGYAAIPAVLIGIPFGTAAGVSIAGTVMGQHGSFKGALLGAYLGFTGVGCLYFGAVITIPLGAVWGYNK